MFQMVTIDNRSHTLMLGLILLAVLLFITGCKSTTVVHTPMDRAPEQLKPTQQYVVKPALGKTRYIFDPSAIQADIQKPALFDSKRRQAYLQNRPSREGMCRTSFSPRPASIITKARGHDADPGVQGKSLRHKAFYQTNQETDLPKMHVQGLTEWLATGEAIHLERVSSELLRWADDGGLTSVVPDHDRMRYIDPLWNLRELLVAPIIAFDVARKQGVLKGDELDRVHRWLANVVKMTDRGGIEGMHFDMGSHPKIQRGYVFMLWGAVGGDDAFLQKGFQEYLDQLERLRPDGSTMEDVSSKQGARSLLKQNQVAGFLVLSAEIAANQGYDLYDLKFFNIDVHDAIKFLLDASEDQSLVTKYSKSKTHFLRYLSNNPSNASLNLAWAEPYIARFWGTELADRLNQYVSKNRPAIGFTYGGNFTCMFAYF